MNARVWIDETAVDTDWPPPSSGDDQPEGRLRRWLPVSLPVLVVILVIVLVAALGGFRMRTDQVIRMQPDATIVTGPYEFVFEKATIQEVNSYGGEEDRAQEVVVYAQARNTWTESLVPRPRQFAASDPAGNESLEATTAGLTSRLYGPTWLTPGLPPAELGIEFEFSSKFDPGDQIRVMISDVSYGDHTFLGVDGEETWDNDGDRFLVWLPVERLPAEEAY